MLAVEVSLADEQLDRLADGRSADAVLLLQLPLGGDGGLRLPLAGLDLFTQDARQLVIAGNLIVWVDHT